MRKIKSDSTQQMSRRLMANTKSRKTEKFAKTRSHIQLQLTEGTDLKDTIKKN